jgi:spermidine/putrescine transport system substrate-binding protein
MVQAWDGWCNYGIGENPDIKYVIPAEGSDLWVDTMVIMSKSENKDAAYAFVNYILDAETHRWAAENILYKVPNKAAMDGLDPAVIATFPNMGITPEVLLGYEQLRDVGEAQRAYSRTVTEIMAAQ